MRPVPISFHLGPLVVHTYGIGLAITFWFAYRYFERRLRERGFRTEWVLGLFIEVTIAAIVGARAMHVLANLSYYRADPMQVFAIWHGGLSSWGGLLLAVPTGVFSARRRCPELGFGAVMDILAPVLAAAWSMGRLLGSQLMFAGGGHRTYQWFGLHYVGQVGKRLPVPLFQSAEDLAIFLVIVYVERRIRRFVESRGGVAALGAPPSGFLIGTGMTLWGIERVLDEKLWLAYPGQLGDVLVEAAGLALAIGGVVVLFLTRRRWRSWLSSAPAGPDRSGPLPGVAISAGDADGGRAAERVGVAERVAGRAEAAPREASVGASRQGAPGRVQG